MRRVPEYISESNNGKGVVLELKLHSLKDAARLFGKIIQIDRILVQLSNETIERIQSELDDFINERQRFIDFHKEINDNADFLPNCDLQKIRMKKDSIQHAETEFREKLTQTLIKVRSGEYELNKLENVLLEFQECGNSSNGIRRFLEEENPNIRNRLNDLIEYKKHGIEFFSKSENFDTFIHSTKNEDVYVLVYPSVSPRDQELYLKNKKFFMSKNINKSLLPNSDHILFMIYDVDVNLASNLLDRSKIAIKYFSNCVEIESDLYRTEEKWEERAIAKCTNLKYAMKKPDKCVEIRLPCPNRTNHNQSLACSVKNFDWHCKRCESRIFYDMGNLFYCNCGGMNYDNYEFKCPDRRHPQETYLKYDSADLKTLLKQMRLKKELNILLVGETGVGKSTLINAFANYLSFETLNEAEKNLDRLVCPIPAEFTINDKNNNQVSVKIGYNDENSENFQIGESATQFTKAHVFTLYDQKDRELLLRIIDTPGIGDTRGFDHDKKNFQNILSFISNYKNLDGICFVLKTPISRITPSFKYYMKEILSNLHRGVSSNIVFCFTHTVNKLSLSDPMRILDKFFDNEDIQVSHVSNVFHFDNESFKYLAARCKGVQFEQNYEEYFSKQWNSSCESMKIMLKYILELPVMMVNDTITLNEARQMVMELSKPLVDITQKINANIKTSQEKNYELSKLIENASSLSKQLTTNTIEYKIVPLGYARVVCSKCNNVCDPYCRARSLYECSELRHRSRCRDCYHKRKYHDRVDTETTTQTVSNPNAQYQYNNCKQRIDEIKKYNTEIESKIEQMKIEKETILNSCAEFAHFTKQNAILAFNDSILEYLEMCIREREQCPSTQESKDILDGLLATKKKYLDQYNQYKIFEDAGKKGGEQISLNRIKNLVENLKSLKLNGSSIMAIFQRMHHAKIGIVEFTGTHYQIERNEAFFKSLGLE